MVTNNMDNSIYSGIQIGIFISLVILATTRDANVLAKHITLMGFVTWILLLEIIKKVNREQ